MNSELYGKEYNIPENVWQNIKTALIRYPNNDGIRRAKFLLNNKKISYSNLKRIKNFFDHYIDNNENKIQYLLYGGNEMKNWINSLLSSERKAVNISKEVKKDSDINISNNNEKPDFKETLRENEDINMTVDKTDNIIHNAIAILFNEDKKILLLKRSENSYWMPLKWAFVGGGIENNETPLEAIKREIFEEIGLKIDILIQKFEIQKDNNKEYYFIGKINRDIENTIKLDTNENTNYGFFSYNEAKFIDTVPNLIDYIDIAISKYNE